jgi:hypothetical protein
MGSAFNFGDCVHFELNGASATNKIHDDRDQSKDQQQMNEEAAHVKNEEPSKPKQYQNNSQNEKHK